MMKAATLDKLIWPAIFGGIVIGAFGLSLPDEAPGLGWTLIAIGVMLIVSGAVLVALRSRLDQ